MIFMIRKINLSVCIKQTYVCLKLQIFPTVNITIFGFINFILLIIIKHIQTYEYNTYECLLNT